MQRVGFCVLPYLLGFLAGYLSQCEFAPFAIFRLENLNQMRNLRIYADLTRLGRQVDLEIYHRSDVLYCNSYFTFYFIVSSNGLRLAAVGDFEKLNCQPSTNVDRSNALQLTTPDPIAANCCYRQPFLSVRYVVLPS
jgi:hypothetical protein